MNEFSYESQYENREMYENVLHLRDAVQSLGLELPNAFGLSEDLDVDSLTAFRDELKAMLDAELKQQMALAKAQALSAAEELERRNKLPSCNIGPYAGGICTICGKRQP